MSSVLLTGASGFLGKYVEEALTLAGHTVRRCGRAEVGDLDQGAQVPWEKVLDGTHAVVHLAARVHQMQGTQDEASYQRINTDATHALAEKAVRAGVKSFVYLSSVKVMGEETQTGSPWQESDQPRPFDAYARSKLAAEKAIQAAVQGTGCTAFVIRPPLVYGPGVRANFRALVKLARLGVPMPLGKIQNRRSLVSVWNLADAVVLATNHGLDSQSRFPACSEFFISDGPSVSTAQLYREISCALGQKPRMVGIDPVILGRVLGFLGKQAAWMRLAGSLEVSDAKIRSQLGYQPRLTLSQGLARMILEEKGSP